MFKKFACLENRNEQLEIFNLLKFNIAFCLQLAYFLALAILISGLGWFISSPLINKLGLTGGTAASVALMLLLVGLIRLPVLWAREKLWSDYDLDLRPDRVKLRKLLLSGLRRSLVIWAVSLIMILGLKELHLWVWTIAATGLCISLTIVEAAFPRLWHPENWRPPEDGELPPGLADDIQRWTPQTGLKIEQVVIATDFSPELEPPRLAGLGSRMRLVIGEKALAAFSPRELRLVATSAVMGSMIKAPARLMFLRLCALAVALPLAAILISTLGNRLFGYPLLISPALIGLVWLALWLGRLLADMTCNLTSRGLDTQLIAAAAIVLKDDQAVETVLTTLADRNLEEPSPPGWREFFRTRFTRKAFLKRVRYNQHLSKFNESGES